MWPQVYGDEHLLSSSRRIWSKCHCCSAPALHTWEVGVLRTLLQVFKSRLGLVFAHYMFWKTKFLCSKPPTSHNRYSTQQFHSLETTSFIHFEVSVLETLKDSLPKYVRYTIEIQTYSASKQFSFLTFPSICTCRSKGKFSGTFHSLLDVLRRFEKFINVNNKTQMTWNSQEAKSKKMIFVNLLDKSRAQNIRFGILPLNFAVSRVDLDW